MKHVVPRHPILLTLWLLTLVAASATPATAAEVVNGGFEQGNLSGWTGVFEPSDDFGEWFVYSGTTPFPTTMRSSGPSPETFYAPPVGEFAAVTDQNDPSRQALYQDVSLESGKGHFLRLYVYYRNHAEAFSAPDNLEEGPNQQYRIDVMRPTSPVFSTSGSDVLRMLFRTDPGDPLEMSPTLMEFDLSEFAGETIRLRFVVMVTEEVLHAAVDAVQIISGRCGGKPATAVGTDGDDTFELGTPGKDVILGLGGNDVIKGRGKNDVICGGPGDDDLKGGGGKDRLIGGSGRDDLNGGAGEDECKGGGGRDEESSC